ncbi:hypothetical protein [Helicobacter pylori]|uniref:hypothetical protein n=1 Tax=Helicobacter pylori TaxID=210 RepID=UPI00165C181F|nr:hypothetical protein [Helicobacter pylori]
MKRVLLMHGYFPQMGLSRLDLVALDIPFLTICIVVNFEVFFLKSLTHRYGALGLKGQKF